MEIEVSEVTIEGDRIIIMVDLMAKEEDREEDHINKDIMEDIAVTKTNNHIIRVANNL